MNYYIHMGHVNCGKYVPKRALIWELRNLNVIAKIIDKHLICFQNIIYDNCKAIL